ncbi:uncharacterized protein LOC114963335 [Acropora millepora]|uniref:uncharacterized protein LOC114963335 n=1 Tax=Acropora millepora TaxID=45264 RepID=UPI001CF49982|nr:uncharacterized protein LOC114963335 [Acropora millepora]
MKRNSQKTVPLSRFACVWKHFLGGQPLLFVFLIGMFIVNNVFAKPLSEEDQDGKLGVFDGEAELEHLPVNETSQSSDKNYVVNGIRDISPACQVSTKPAHGCVRTWLYCKFNWVNLTEPQCASQSSGCFPSVTRFGFPKCKPIYKWMQIKLPNGQKKRLKLNTDCVCA